MEFIPGDFTKNYTPKKLTEQQKLYRAANDLGYQGCILIDTDAPLGRQMIAAERLIKDIADGREECESPLGLRLAEALDVARTEGIDEWIENFPFEKIMQELDDDREAIIASMHPF